MQYIAFTIIVCIVLLGIFITTKNLAKRLIAPITYRTVVIVSFIVILASGLIGGFFSKQTVSQAENRQLQQWKPIKLKKPSEATPQIERYINDHFGFRDFFITIYQKVQNGIFKQPISGKVIIGKNDWLFLSTGVNTTYLQKHLTVEKIEKTKIIEQIKNINSFLNERNIKLFIVISPSKPYIYPEYLPKWVDKKQNGRKTIDNFKYLIENQTDIPILDLYADIQTAKNSDKNPLYYKNDTHWNTVGAFYALKSLTAFLQKHHVKLHQYDYNKLITEKDISLGDLCNMMNIKRIENYTGYSLEGKPQKTTIKIADESRTPMKIKKTTDTFDINTHFMSYNDTTEHNCPLLIADSYWLGNKFHSHFPFRKFYSMHYMFTQPALTTLIASEKDIDVVILSFVDRSFNHFVEQLSTWQANNAPEINITWGND